MAESKIEWTDATWNPVVGCTRASAGCDNCYAVVMTKRLEAMGQEKYKGLVNLGKNHFNGVVRTVESDLLLPLKWKKPRKVFVNSMSDLFHKDVPFDFIDKVFAVMALTPHHTYQILTKRPERMAEWTNECGYRQCLIGEQKEIIEQRGSGAISITGTPVRWPLPNVWLGTSCEDQAAADGRIPHLLKCPAAVQFLSCEPLLGPIDLSAWLPIETNRDGSWRSRTKFGEPAPNLWCIAGGESGHKARPAHPDWFRSLREQCVAAAVSFHFKQVGEWTAYQLSNPLWQNCYSGASEDSHRFPDGLVDFPEDHPRWRFDFEGVPTTVWERVGKKAAGRLLDGRTWDEFPEVQP